MSVFPTVELNLISAGGDLRSRIESKWLLTPRVLLRRERYNGVHAHFKTEGGRDYEQLSQSPTLKLPNEEVNFTLVSAPLLLRPLPAWLDHWPPSLTSAPGVRSLNLLQTAPLRPHVHPGGEDKCLDPRTESALAPRRA